MRKVILSDIFSTEYLDMIVKYTQRIQDYLSSYDVIVFMARKSICFYKALVKNGEIIANDKCLVLSSRSLTYNILETLKGKRIAIIDDVIVTGKTLSDSSEFFEKNNVDVDIHFMACKRNFAEELSFSKHIKSPYICLSSLSIYQLSNYITEYIGVSMIPYNIDQPIYNIEFDCAEDIDNIIRTNNTTNLADGAEKTYGIKNFSVHFKNEKLTEIFDLNSQKNDLIFKIRFLCHHGDTNLIATPFVMLPQINYSQIDELFNKLFKGEYIHEAVSIKNKAIEYENKLKIVQYQLSDILFHIFLKTISYKKFNKDTDNEILLFGTIPFSESVATNFKHANFPSNIEQVPGISNYGEFDELVSNFYDYIFSEINSQDSQNSTNEYVLNKLITFKGLSTNLQHSNKWNISTIIDVFIDKGILVPEFIHYDTNSIVRGYKCGEIFHLTRKGIELFAYMLDQYASTKDGVPLDKIELEKLCVLFFKNAAYKNRLFSTAKKFEEDCFSICYSKFGPRVSDSDRKYKVINKSALASVLEDRQMAYLYKDKYQIPQASTPVEKKWAIIATNFALSYCKLRKCFEKKVVPESPYIKTYNDFLTLLAIGDSKKNQMFALMAELYLLTQIDMHSSLQNILDSMDSYAEIREEKNITKRYRGIMDGIDSGLWKYMCFCQKDLVDTTFTPMITEYNDIRYIKEEYIFDSDERDENETYEELIKKCGSLLYEIAYLFNYARKRSDGKEKNSIFRNSSFENPKFKSMRMAIRNHCQTASEDEIKRDLKTLKKRALALINECDLCIEEAAFRSVRVFDNIVVLYSYDKISKLGNELNLKPNNENDIIRKCIFIKGDHLVNIPQQLHSVLQRYNLLDKEPLILFVKIDNSYEGIFDSEHTATGDYFKELIRTAIKKSGYQESESTCKIMICSRSDNMVQNGLLDFDHSGELMDGYKYSQYKLVRGDSVMNNNNNGNINLTFNGPVGAVGNNNVVNQNNKIANNLDEFFDDVQKIDTSIFNDNEGAIGYINEIKQDALKKDKDTVLTKLGKLAEKIGSSVFAKIASSLIVEVMKANGYLPF